jgi:hypothetical protein
MSTPLPTHYPNYKGVPTPINWPEGRVVAVCGGVYMIDNQGSYAVVYGLQIKVGFASLNHARVEFSHCVAHQIECNNPTEEVTSTTNTNQI